MSLPPSSLPPQHPLAPVSFGDAGCLFADNHDLILQGVEVLSGLPPELYASEDERCLGGSIGGHTRHCVEFYHCFLSALDTGCLDYDARPREKALESDSAAACESLRHTAGMLRHASLRHGMERPLRVIENHGSGEPSWAVSSVGRELLSLLSHTVHHYALIAILLRLNGRETPPDFGIAPSTLRHRAAQASTESCAP